MFWKLWKIFKKSENFENPEFWFSIRFSMDFFRKYFQNFWIFWEFPKISKIFHIFFDFLIEFFMNFKIFWCSGKLKLCSLQKVVCLFIAVDAGFWRGQLQTAGQKAQREPVWERQRKGINGYDIPLISRKNISLKNT